MSIILDALKKLERERSSRRYGTVNVAEEILQPDRIHSGRSIRLLFFAIFFSTLAAAAVAYVAYVRLQSKPTPPTPVVLPAPPATPAPPAYQVIRPARVQESTVRPVVQNPPPNRLEDSKSSSPPAGEKPVRNEIRKETAPAPEPSLKPAPSQGKDKPSRSPALEKPQPPAEQPPKSAPSPPKESPRPAPPQLKINAIVWFNEPSERRAVINGLSVQEGEMIEGAKVVEIFPGRVRFSHFGQTFDVSMPN